MRDRERVGAKWGSSEGMKEAVGCWGGGTTMTTLRPCLRVTQAPRWAEEPFSTPSRSHGKLGRGWWGHEFGGGGGGGVNRDTTKTKSWWTQAKHLPPISSFFPMGGNFFLKRGYVCCWVERSLTKGKIHPVQSFKTLFMVRGDWFAFQGLFWNEML